MRTVTENQFQSADLGGSFGPESGNFREQAAARVVLDETLVKLCEASGLSIGKWAPYLSRWHTALESTNTPVAFLDSLRVEADRVRADGYSIKLHIFNFPDRSELRSWLAEENRFSRRLPEAPLPENVDHNCALCERLIELHENQLLQGGPPKSVIESTEQIVWGPNIYPWEIGGSLIIPRVHDHFAERVTPVREQRGLAYPIEEGKTRAALLQSPFLLESFRRADESDLVVLRNHPLDGMSEPYHDHVHLFPVDLPKGALMRALRDRYPAESSEVHWQMIDPDLTPFNGLILASSDRDHLARTAAQLMQRLELDHQVFTFSYYDGRLLVTGINPESAGCGALAKGHGARVPLLYLTREEFDSFESLVERYSRDFPWKQYLTA